jgi:hypothetical protein
VVEWGNIFIGGKMALTLTRKEFEQRLRKCRPFLKLPTIDVPVKIKGTKAGLIRVSNDKQVNDFFDEAMKIVLNSVYK